MTHLLNEAAFAALGGPNLVYVREITASEILHEAAPESLEELELSPEQILFAVHGADGSRLAVVTDRDTAYAAAIAHELTPVAVH